MTNTTSPNPIPLAQTRQTLAQTHQTQSNPNSLSPYPLHLGPDQNPTRKPTSSDPDRLALSRPDPRTDFFFLLTRCLHPSTRHRRHHSSATAAMTRTPPIPTQDRHGRTISNHSPPSSNQHPRNRSPHPHSRFQTHGNYHHQPPPPRSPHPNPNHH